MSSPLKAAKTVVKSALNLATFEKGTFSNPLASTIGTLGIDITKPENPAVTQALTATQPDAIPGLNDASSIQAGNTAQAKSRGKGVSSTILTSPKGPRREAAPQQSQASPVVNIVTPPNPLVNERLIGRPNRGRYAF